MEYSLRFKGWILLRFQRYIVNVFYNCACPYVLYFVKRILSFFLLYSTFSFYFAVLLHTVESLWPELTCTGAKFVFREMFSIVLSFAFLLFHFFLSSFCSLNNIFFLKVNTRIDIFKGFFFFYFFLKNQSLATKLCIKKHTTRRMKVDLEKHFQLPVGVETKTLTAHSIFDFMRIYA